MAKITLSKVVKECVFCLYFVFTAKYTRRKTILSGPPFSQSRVITGCRYIYSSWATATIS